MLRNQVVNKVIRLHSELIVVSALQIIDNFIIDIPPKHFGKAQERLDN